MQMRLAFSGYEFDESRSKFRHIRSIASPVTDHSLQAMASVFRLMLRDPGPIYTRQEARSLSFRLRPHHLCPETRKTLSR